MKRGVKFSGLFVAASAASIVALSSMIWLRVELNKELSEQRRRAKDFRDSQSMLISNRSMFENSDLNALREKVGRFRAQLGGEGTWDLLVRRFGKDWIAETGLKEDRSAYSLQFGTFQLRSPSLADWSRIVEAVKDSEATRGVMVEEFEMRTSGNREHRSLDLVRILVSVKIRRSAMAPPTAP